MKNILKKIAIGILLLQICILIPPISVKAAPSGKQMFMISAYYSPLPNQSFYVKGSFAADKRLNGNGTNGADGTEVYVGMLAAPRSYPFGTKIKIPGLGVGEVHDRGGAILSKKNYDRIDVWMGKGEEGLARALNWGMRLVEGEIYPSSSSIKPVLNYQWVNSKLPANAEKRLISRTETAKLSTNIVKKVVKKEEKSVKEKPGIDVNELQKSFSSNGYYFGKNGIYTKKEEPTEAFKIAKKIILDIESDLNKDQMRLQENAQMLEVGLGKESFGDRVYRLQQMLWELGYYKGNLDGIYNDTTIDAVFEFQKDYKVVNDEYDLGAGYFGIKTHAALVAAIGLKIEKHSEYPKEMQSFVPAKIDLPSLDSFEKVEVVKRAPLNFSL